MNYDIKQDKEKIRLELIPPEAMWAIAAVRTYGIQKYGDKESWRQVEAERYIGALLRHLAAHMGGEKIDPESGLPHMWHVLCNAAFLVALYWEGEEPPAPKKLTLRKKLAMEHPEAIDPKERGGCAGCPEAYGYRPAFCIEQIPGETKEQCCTRCWDREAEEKP